MKPDIAYLPDAKVDTTADQAIRDLLTICFTSTEDDVFQHRRYWKEPYPNRWIVRGPDGTFIAHVGVHEKEVRAGDVCYRFGGIAEVCVHPDHRGRGLVRAMLAVIHPWLARHGFVYGILFGNPDVYTSSGYQGVTNLTMDEDPPHPDGRRHPVTGAMVHPLTPTLWPEDEVFLPGLTF